MTEKTQPTDAELDEIYRSTFLAMPNVARQPPQTVPPMVRDFARAVLAKWGTPPAVAGEPVATVIKNGADRQWMSERLGHLPDGIYSLYLTPQPTQAQADTPCRKNPFYHGPRNCSRGTVGCCEDHGAKPQAQAGAVPLTDEQITIDGLMMTPNSVLQNCADAFEAGARFAERHHGIKGGQHGAE